MSEHITRISLAEAAKHDRTDWAHLSSLSDEQIDQAIAGDPDTFTIGNVSAHYAILRDAQGQWRWKLIAKNGEVLAESGRSFPSRLAVTKAIAAVRTALAVSEAA